MPIVNNFLLNKEAANSFLSRKLLANTIHRFEEFQQGNLERECREEVCNYEEAREVYENDIDGLNQFWTDYTGQNNSITSSESAVSLILGIIFGVVGFFIILILLFVLWKRRKGELDKKINDNEQPYTPYPMLSYYAGREAGTVQNHYESPLLDGMDSDLAHGLSECYIERERLQLGSLITTGNFGEVREGKLRMRDRSVLEVAVKSLKSLDDPEAIEKFLREGVMMKGFEHKHVLALIGVCVESDVDDGHTSPLIVLPYMSNGDLRTYLRNGSIVLTVLDLMKYCYQVALGMEYLASKKFVHRDLAARNCMVDVDGTVKVADFGLSRDLYDRDYYKSNVKTQLPLKWMAPESIQYGRYDEKTDVWSYGVVCWEVITRGAIPYPTVEGVDILRYLSEGNRMERPECCSSKLYKSMKECWKEDPDLRPTFAELVHRVLSIINDARSDKKRSKEQRHRSGDAEAAGDVRREDSSGRPKAKPRTSLKKKANERSDKYGRGDKKKANERPIRREREESEEERSGSR